MYKNLVIVMFIISLFPIASKVDLIEFLKFDEELIYNESKNDDNQIKEIGESNDTIENGSKNVKKEETLPKKESDDTNNKKNDSKKQEEKTNSNIASSKQKEWDKLGISEYDYYNSPEISWKTVEFSVKEYGNMENAKKACYNAGVNYNDIEDYRFRCYESYSYSGDFLGYHIEYFELES